MRVRGLHSSAQGRCEVITADNITDEQIRELAQSKPRLSMDDWSATQVARMPAWRVTDRRRAEARARCAEILNARAAQKDGAK